MKHFILTVMAILIFSACQKEPITPEPQPTPSEPSLPENFPENTSWNATQTITLNDTLDIPVKWGLDFWDDYYEAWNGQINYCGDSVCCGKTLYWQYNKTAQTGTVFIDGKSYPFSYDPITEILTLTYSTTIYGKNIPIGGTLQFELKQEE